MHRTTDYTRLEVTPRAGVWIETKYARHSYIAMEVTPRAGVWIETQMHKKN